MQRLHLYSSKGFQDDAIFLIMYIVYPGLAIIGGLGNFLVIAILAGGQCGLSGCVSRYLISMAVADLAVVVTDVMLTRLNFLFLPVCFLDLTVACKARQVLLRTAADSSAWMTAAFSIDRSIAIASPRLRASYCTERTAGAVISLVWLLSIVNNIPWYLAYEPWFTVDGSAWFCRTIRLFYVSTEWRAFNLLDIILTPFLAFLLILVCNVLTVKQVVAANKLRRGLVRTRADRVDPEIESRRKGIILLFMISGSFILLWMVYVAYAIFGLLFNYSFTGFKDPIYIFYETSRILQLSCSTTNTCIYVACQNRFRQELKKILTCPYRLLSKLVKS